MTAAQRAQRLRDAWIGDCFVEPVGGVFAHPDGAFFGSGDVAPLGNDALEEVREAVAYGGHNPRLGDGPEAEGMASAVDGGGEVRPRVGERSIEIEDCESCVCHGRLE